MGNLRRDGQGDPVSQSWKARHVRTERSYEPGRHPAAPIRQWLRLSLAVALLLAAIAGALLMAAAGTARITQLRRVIRRGRYLGQPRNTETTDAPRP